MSGQTAPVAVSEMLMPARCAYCPRVYDLGSVTVIARYVDCSVWKCPGCGTIVDDRGETGWKSRKDYHLITQSGGRGATKVGNHASPGCACGVNEAGESYIDPICVLRDVP